jgi:excisionase family DNA binding protein
MPRKKRVKVTKTPEELLIDLKILNNRPALTIPEAARFLRCNNDTAYALVKMGRLKVMGYGTRMISKTEVDRFMREDATDPSLKSDIKDFMDNEQLLKSKEEQINIVAMRG